MRVFCSVPPGDWPADTEHDWIRHQEKAFDGHKENPTRPFRFIPFCHGGMSVGKEHERLHQVQYYSSSMEKRLYLWLLECSTNAFYAW